MQGMEKNTPHYRLDDIKAVIAERNANTFTTTARLGAVAMGLTMEMAVAVVLSLTRVNFYKSMTTHADHRVWQDVYRSFCPNGRMAYIKLTLQEGNVVIQFKEL